MDKKVLDKLRKQQDDLKEQIKQAERVLNETEREARKRLIPRYRITKIVRNPVNKRTIWGDRQFEQMVKRGIKYMYRFQLELVNDNEYEQHLKTYGTIVNRPDEKLNTVAYYWMPVGVTERGNMGVIAHDGGGRLIIHDYTPVTWEEWEQIIEGNIPREYTNTNIVMSDSIKFIYND